MVHEYLRIPLSLAFLPLLFYGQGCSSLSRPIILSSPALCSVFTTVILVFLLFLVPLKNTLFLDSALLSSQHSTLKVFQSLSPLSLPPPFPLSLPPPRSLTSLSPLPPFLKTFFSLTSPYVPPPFSSSFPFSFPLSSSSVSLSYPSLIHLFPLSFNPNPLPWAGARQLEPIC